MHNNYMHGGKVGCIGMEGRKEVKTECSLCGDKCM